MAPGFLRLARRSSRFDLDFEKNRERSREIDRQLRIHAKELGREFKVLLLGAADSGKSTIIKQMKIINDGGFGVEERKTWKNIIFNNLVDAFLYLFKLMETQDTELQYTNNSKHRSLLEKRRNIGPDERLPLEYFDCFQELWDDDGLNLTLLKGVESILSNNLGYFLDNLKRLFEANYIPTEKDILYAKSKTNGVVESRFALHGHTYLMVDVAGQRSERRKWASAFDDVACVIFVASISAYDQCIPEDQNKSQTEEALDLFKKISNDTVFKRAALVLFLNKIDLLRWKLESGMSPVHRFYPDYTAGADVKKCHAYFADKFKRLYKDKDKELYIHFTNATDTDLLKTTMGSVQLMILQNSFSRIILH